MITHIQILIQIQQIEIIIITDGLDHASTGAFYGLRGYDELMKRFKNSDTHQMCRMYVMCVSDQCKGTTGKHYRDVAMGTKGVYCNHDDIDVCVSLVVLPHYYREVFGEYFFEKHVKMVSQGEARQLPWIEKDIYNILKVEL